MRTDLRKQRNGIVLRDCDAGLFLVQLNEVDRLTTRFSILDDALTSTIIHADESHIGLSVQDIRKWIVSDGRRNAHTAVRVTRCTTMAFIKPSEPFVGKKSRNENDLEIFGHEQIVTYDAHTWRGE